MFASRLGLGTCRLMEDVQNFCASASQRYCWQVRAATHLSCVVCAANELQNSGSWKSIPECTAQWQIVRLQSRAQRRLCGQAAWAVKLTISGSKLKWPQHALWDLAFRTTLFRHHVCYETVPEHAIRQRVNKSQTETRHKVQKPSFRFTQQLGACGRQSGSPSKRATRRTGGGWNQISLVSQRDMDPRYPPWIWPYYS